MKRQKLNLIIAIIELLLVILIVCFDFFIPTIVILLLMVLGFLIRKKPFSSLGFKKLSHPWKTIGLIFLFSLLWSLFHLSFTMPILNHLTGTKQNLSSFTDMQGNGGKLLFLLAMSWTLAAIGEETVYRGYIPNIILDIVGRSKGGVILSVFLSSLFFGLAHVEQGIIGVVLTFLDALFCSYLKNKYDNNLWASVLAHGFNNTTGLVAFYFFGPLYGFW